MCNILRRPYYRPYYVASRTDSTEKGAHCAPSPLLTVRSQLDGGEGVVRRRKTAQGLLDRSDGCGGGVGVRALAWMGLREPGQYD